MRFAVTSDVRVVGIDLGERRIGVAVSDASGTLARPLKTIERGASDAEAVERLQRDDCGARGRRRSRLGRRRAADAARRLAQSADAARRHDGDAALGAPRGSGVHTGRAAVEPRSRGAAVAPRKGLAQAQGEARRGRRGGHPAGLPGCTIPAQGRGKRGEGRQTSEDGHSCILVVLAVVAAAGVAWHALQADERAVQGLRRSRAVRDDRAGQRHAHDRSAPDRGRRHPQRRDLSRGAVAKRSRAQPAGRASSASTGR